MTQKSFQWHSGDDRHLISGLHRINSCHMAHTYLCPHFQFFELVGLYTHNEALDYLKEVQIFFQIWLLCIISFGCMILLDPAYPLPRAHSLTLNLSTSLSPFVSHYIYSCEPLLNTESPCSHNLHSHPFTNGLYTYRCRSHPQHKWNGNLHTRWDSTSLV